MLRARWIQKLLGRSGQQSATAIGRDWHREAEELKKKKHWIRLVRHCQKWVQAEPTDSFGWHSLGNAHILVKQYRSAVAAYRQGLRLNPTAATWGGLSYAHHLLKQIDHAIEALQSKEEVMRTDPEDALANDVTAMGRTGPLVPLAQSARENAGGFTRSRTAYFQASSARGA